MESEELRGLGLSGGRDILLCSYARYFNLTASLFLQVLGRLDEALGRGGRGDETHDIRSERAAILLVASYY